MYELDCRGLDCPQPVLKTKAVIEKGLDEIKVRVDNEAASENVVNFLQSQGFSVSQEKDEWDFFLFGHRTGEAEVTGVDPSLYECRVPAESRTGICVLIATDRIGRGDDELGRKLMTSYLATLEEMGSDLWRVILLNAGVNLAVEGAEGLESLRELEEDGVSILVCGTCLTYFDLLDKKVVGETTNMLDVVTSLQVADKVINLS